MLFGGIIGSGYINDTWVWDGSIWTQKFPQTSPSARAYYGMAYDSKRGEAVLFGGQLQNIYDVDETWVWDGSNWSQKDPQTKPPARLGTTLAYDSARGQTLMFSGRDINTGITSADTWVWDGNNWSQKSPQTSPSARSEAALAYDSTRGQMVLFGGHDQVAYNAADTWVWDGSNWSQEFPQTSPNGRSGHSLAYDPVHDQVILFGGAADSETWAWNGGAAPTAGPSITAAVSASAFGGFPTVAPGSWIEIYGSNLAPTTRAWNGTDFIGNNAPTSLEGVQVNIGGQKAFVEYISTTPAQINAQLPSNIPIGGTLQLTVTNPNGTSPPFDIQVNQNQPGLLAPALFQISGKQYVVALLPDGAYALPPGSIAGVASRPAKPGETIVLFGIGFGSVTPDIPAGQIVTESNQLTQPFELWFGNTLAQLSYHGLAPAAVGLYQFNAVVPPVQDSDAVPLTFNLDRVPGTQNLSIAVHR